MSPPDVNSFSTPPQVPSGSQNTQHHSQVPTAASRTQYQRRDSGASSRRQSLQLFAGSDNFPTMPRRHSRPMTPAELHTELEREQEGIVNRLSRELDTLRQHSSSIASNASAGSSSTSAAATSTVAQPLTPLLNTPSDPLNPSSSTSALLTTSQSLTQPISSPRHPPLTRHRSSSSSLSSRAQSLTSSSPAFSLPQSATNAHPSLTASQASVDRARDAAGIPAHPHMPQSRSRQNSMRSGQPSPALFGDRPASRSGRRQSAQMPTGRVEEAAAARKGLEDARTEHDELVRRAKELERELRGLGPAEENRGRAPARGPGVPLGGTSCRAE